MKWPEFGQSSNYWGSDVEKAKLKLQGLIFDEASSRCEKPPFTLKEIDVLGRSLNRAVEGRETEFRNQIYEMFHLAATASGSKPSRKYTAASDDILEKVDAKKYKAFVQEWLLFLVDSKEDEVENTYTYMGRDYTHVVRSFLDGKNATLVKGLVWSLVKYHDTATLDAVAKLAERSFRKIPGRGPTCAGVGNACLYVLANTKGLGGVSQLSRLKLRITQANTRKLIETYLREGAERLGISPSELEELAVPDFGLKAGSLEQSFDDYRLRLTVTGVGKTSLEWIKPDGSPQKSTPAFVKQNKKHGGKLRKMKDLSKQVQKYLTAQRDRIDRLYIDDRKWTAENFDKYYLNHGLVSFIARRLIWVLETEGGCNSAIWRDNGWEDAEGRPVDADATEFRLWHPLLAEETEVIAWRNRLEALKLQQPIKQAYREVYILTDAELTTRVYSNRMAAHILKQHQLNALVGLRGWRYQLLGAFDDGRDGERARMELPAHGMRCEYWINEIHSDQDFNDAYWQHEYPHGAQRSVSLHCSESW